MNVSDACPSERREGGEEEERRRRGGEKKGKKEGGEEGREQDSKHDQNQMDCLHKGLLVLRWKNGTQSLGQGCSLYFL